MSNQPKSAVTCPEVAKVIILNYLKKNKLQGGEFFIRKARCECGETYKVHWHNFEQHAEVVCCEMCGDDNAFIDEVLTTY